MECRKNCGVCCIILSISSSVPGMHEGKPAGKRCIHLNKDLTCNIFDSTDRPKVCGQYKAEELVCGNSRDEAIKILSELEGVEWDNCEL